MARFVHRRSVLFQEIDAAGIIFFARVFEWFHDAYAACLAERGLHFDAILKAGVWGIPVVHAEADYKLPLTYGTRIAVEIDTLTLGEGSLTVTYTVKSESGTIHATGKTVHAFIDRKTFRPRGVPEEVTQALAA